MPKRRPFSAPASENLEGISDAMLRCPRSSAAGSRTSLKWMQRSRSFPQGFATVHIAEVSMQVLRTFPGSHFSFRGRHMALPLPWPCSNVKREVYETRPANIADLRQRILESIQRIPKKTLQRVMTAFPSPVQECTERHGGHLRSVIFKQWLRWILTDMEFTR
jgi:hypothetical protein